MSEICKGAPCWQVKGGQRKARREPKPRLPEPESISTPQGAAEKGLVSGARPRPEPECLAPGPSVALAHPHDFLPDGFLWETFKGRTQQFPTPTPKPTLGESMRSHRQIVSPHVGAISFILTALARLRPCHFTPGLW